VIDVNQRQLIDDQAITGEYRYGIHVVTKNGLRATEGDYGISPEYVNFIEK